MRSILFIFLLMAFGFTSKAQVYYHYARDEKELSKLLPVKDTVTVLKYGRQMASGYPRFVVYDEEIDFPDSLLYFTNLKSLKIGIKTKLRSLSPEIGKLHNLEKLELYTRKISSEIGDLSNLKKLVLYGLKSEIPKEFGALKKLEYLYLSNDSITKFPEEYFELENIRTLQISMDGIDSIPLGLSKLEHLEELHFYCNRLKKLPEDIWKIKSLKKIILDVNRRVFDFSSSFELISKSTSIENIDFNYMVLEDMPSLSVLQNIKTLKIETRLNDLKELNTRLTELAKIKNLEFLDIELPYDFHDEIKVIPDSIHLFKNLKTLIIRGQSIDSIPLWVSEMDKLKLIHIKEISYLDAEKNRKRMCKTGSVIIKYGPEEAPKVYTKIKHPIKEMKINDTLRITYHYRSIRSYGNYYSYEHFLVKNTNGFELLLKLIENNDFKQTGWVHYPLLKKEITVLEKIDKAHNIYRERKKKPGRRLLQKEILSFQQGDNIKTIVNWKKLKAFLAIYHKYENKAYPIK